MLSAIAMIGCLSLQSFADRLAPTRASVSIRSVEIKQMVANKNAKLKGKALDVEAMSKRQGHLLRSFLPTLELRAAHERFSLGPNYTRTQPDYGAEVRANLFNGTRDVLQGQLIDRRTQKSEAELKVVLYQETIKAKELYWNVVFLNERERRLRTVVELNKRNLESALKRIRSGVATTADRYEFEMKQTDVLRELERTNMQKRIVLRELVALVGLPDGSQLNVSDSLDHQHDLSLLNGHSEAQHQFLAVPAKLRAEEDELLSEIQHRSWWPKVEAFAAVNHYNVRNGNVFDAQEGRETVVGVRLNMNTGDLISGNREASALQLEAESSKAEARYLERQIENEAHSEIELLQFLHQQVHSAEENIKKAEEYMKLTLNEYSRGVKNSPDVLGATDKFLDAQLRYLEILRDFQVTRDHLLAKNSV